ncbi:cardiolipin synthase ClsB [Pantoea sp. B65]|uniref:cardiolipin synthase ClsB n=1 Tax=Pantoea sp. B65 TaxID=2813359 RepID=UPI0039B3E40A
MNMQWRDGNRIRLLENGEAFFPRVYGAIRRAEQSLLLETFILFEDAVGNELHGELLAAAQRGVKIEIMVDGYGSADLSDNYVHSLTSAGVRFIYYDPRPLVFGMRTNVFRRLHRKIVVADGEIAFVGGINFSEEHNSSYGAQAKQDYAVEVKGPVVADITRYVQQEIGSQQITRRWWGHRSHRPAHNNTPGDAQALFVWRDNDQHRDDIEQHYMDMLRSAQQDVIIANAYFFPGYRLLREMRNAARRGVKVKLIVQGEPDMPIVKVGAELLYNYLLDAGVEVYEYIRRPLHGKIAVKDQQWATVGSSNLDPLSLSLNLEANLIIHDRQFNQLLRDNLQGLIARDCQRVDGSKLPKRSWWQLSKSVLVFHFLRHFPAIAGWLPAHTPKLALVEPPVQPEMETQDRVETDNPGAKS